MRRACSTCRAHEASGRLRPPRHLRCLLALFVRPFVGWSPTERAILIAVAMLHGAAIGWGLPSSDAWDVDGVAPRDFLPGLIASFTPGNYYTYPPLHLALLALLTLPVTLVVLARAPSLTPDGVLPLFLSTSVMTVFSVVARSVSLLMSIGVVMVVGRIAGLVFRHRRAPAWAMAIAGVEVAGTYYAHTSNLDVPALFWSSLALLVLVQAVRADAPRKLRRVAVFAAFAIATKDQAYAVFAVTMPVVLIAWTLATPRGCRAALLREALLCAASVSLLILVVDGALINPRGFAARLAFLSGSASQDFAQYPHTWSGRAEAFADVLGAFSNHYPLALAPVLVVGAIVAARRHEDRRRRIAALVPLLAALSFTLAFNCVARRVEERFMLPQMQLVAVYAGVLAPAVDLARRRGGRWLAVLVRVGAAACVVLGLHLALSLVFTMLSDARYDAERWIAEHVAPGEVIEVYSTNTYLPRFSASMTVERVNLRPSHARTPMPNITEVEARLSDVEARRPRWIVVGMGYAWRYLQTPPADEPIPHVQRQNLADDDTRDYLRALFAHHAGYRVAHVSHYAGSALFPPRPMHASLATDVFIFERQP